MYKHLSTVPHFVASSLEIRQTRTQLDASVESHSCPPSTYRKIQLNNKRKTKDPFLIPWIAALTKSVSTFFLTSI